MHWITRAAVNTIFAFICVGEGIRAFHTVATHGVMTKRLC